MATIAKTKEELFKTAIARVSCAAFKAGDFLAVRHYYVGENGTHWYMVSPTNEGLESSTICYPEHQLTNFVL